MTIRIKAATHLRPYQAELTRQACEITYCSDECVFRCVPNDAQVVVQSTATHSVALVSVDKLWLNISNETHPADHPLYVGEQQITAAERAQILRTIQHAQLAHIVTLRDVCDCGMIMDVLDGLPLASVHQRPAWHRNAFRSAHDDALATMTWPAYLGVMADLAEGVQALHERGIVHGDLFAFNAIVQDAQHGIWIDLNDVLPATLQGKAIDVWAFVTYTLLTSLLRLTHWQPDVIAGALAIVAREPLDGMLSRLASHLRSHQHSADQVPLDNQALAQLGTMYQQHDPQQRADELGTVARLLTTKGLLHFHRSYEWNAAVALERERYLAAEQTRHMLVEHELHRAMTARYEPQVVDLKNWIDELERGKAWLDEQRATLQAALEQQRTDLEQQQVTIEQQQAWIAELEQGKAWLDEQRHTWQAEAERRAATIDEQRQWIAELEQAKAWHEQQAAHWQAQATHWQAQFERVPKIVRKFTDTAR